MAAEAKIVARAAVAALAAGLVAAAAEMVIVIPAQASLGVPPVRVFQFIASGLLGKAAFASGAFGVAVGVAAHVLISLAAAAIYVVALVRVRSLARRPILGGAIYGLLIFLAMTFVIVPLSRIGAQPLPPPVLAAVSLAVHLFAFGVPLALVATLLLGRREGMSAPEVSR
jgi:uncharacterized membrane protein YagU involved in acid resistance